MLKNIKREINLYRRYRYWADSGCIFIHVPKAAGTSINNALYGRTLGHYTARQVRRKFPRLYQRSFTFSLVRNPWDRVLSAYRFARAGKTDSMGVENPAQYQISEFKSFERFVLEWLPAQDVYVRDFIFQPQHLFVCDDNDNVIVDHLGRFENIGRTMLAVEEKLKKNVDFKKLNSTGNIASDYRSSYTKTEMINVVESAYKRDIKIFGYKF